MSGYILDSIIITVIIIYLCMHPEKGPVLRCACMCLPLSFIAMFFLVFGYQKLVVVRGSVGHYIKFKACVLCGSYDQLVSSANIAGVLDWTGGCQ